MMDLRNQKKRRNIDDLIEHLETFNLELKFSTNLQHLSPPANPYHARYSRSLDVKERLEIVAKLKNYGLEAIELTYPDDINEKTIRLFEGFCHEMNIRIISVMPNLVSDPQFEFGSLTSPCEKAQTRALERVIAVLELNEDLDTEYAMIWPGIDGFESSFGVNMMAIRDQFCIRLAQAIDEVTDIRVALVPKLRAPRGRALIGNTAEALLLAQKIETLLTTVEHRERLFQGDSLVTLAIDTEAVKIAHENLNYALSLSMEYGKLAHLSGQFYIRDNGSGESYDSLYNFSTIESALYLLKMYGYQGYLGLNVHSERIPPTQALKNAIDRLRIANETINRLDHEKIIKNCLNPEMNRGWLDAYLIRMLTPNPDKLPPLDFFQI